MYVPALPLQLLVRRHPEWVDRPVAVYTGRLVSYKGLPRLLRLWKDLRAEGSGALCALPCLGGCWLYHRLDAERQRRPIHDVRRSPIGEADALDGV